MYIYPKIIFNLFNKHRMSIIGQAIFITTLLICKAELKKNALMGVGERILIFDKLLQNKNLTGALVKGGFDGAVPAFTPDVVLTGADT